MVRIKQRYILGELVFEDGQTIDLNKLTQRKVLENFRRTLHELYGDIGLAKAQPNFYCKLISYINANLNYFLSVKFWNVTTRIFILRVGRENLDMACTSLIFMTSFAETINELAPSGGSETPCRVRILHVGGTLEKVEKRYK